MAIVLVVGIVVPGRGLANEPVTDLATAESGGRVDRVPKLIEWSAVELRPDQIAASIDQMESRPFDGLVVRVDDEAGRQLFWEAWGHRRLRVEEFREDVETLRRVPFVRLSERFLRVNVMPADVDWLDEDGWDTILNNMRVAAEIARLTGCRGILFDTEQYGPPLFDPDATINAIHDRRTLSGRVTRCGREWIDAIESELPDPVILMTFGYRTALAPPQSWNWDGKYRLLADFLDGVLAAADEGTRLIDGWEHSYGYTRPEQFAAARRTILEESLEWTARPARYRTRVRAGFGLWTDYCLDDSPWSQTDFSANFHSPDQFRRMLEAAFRNADEYVWLYSGEPDWWTGDSVPPQYFEAIRLARSGAGIDTR
ncbi:MAG: hypothetical protein AAF532_00030 [Planctomycetota bacterium]